MGLTPMDIEKQTFEVRMRGFDREQVARFLSAVAEDLTKLIAVNGRIEEEVAVLRRRLEEYQGRDKKIQESLLALREMTEKMKDEARREGDQLLREARQKADQVLQDARNEGLRLEGQISQLRIDRDHFEDRMRMMLEEHLRILHQRRQEPHDSIPVAGRRAVESEQ